MHALPPVDLRSDTVTRPTAAMRAAIAAAPVGATSKTATTR
ncbi:MAG: beta-eliminating lyase-related protein [Rubrivivax sp.]|nr:beta-eliminating lyase-related protein [Rubrivivax sp.]